MKINYLAYINFGFGFISFLTGIIPFIVFISTIFGAISGNYPLGYDELSNNYLSWVLKTDYGIVFSCVFILLGLSTNVVGFIASIVINDKLQRGISFLGNVFGVFGIIGNLITLVITLVPKS